MLRQNLFLLQQPVLALLELFSLGMQGLFQVQAPVRCEPDSLLCSMDRADETLQPCLQASRWLGDVRQEALIPVVGNQELDLFPMNRKEMANEAPG